MSSAIDLAEKLSTFSEYWSPRTVTQFNGCDVMVVKVKGDTFKGEVLVQRHTTPRDNDNPLFGGPNPVGVGVSGTFTDTRGSMNGTALVGKASQIFGATLHKLADIN